MSIDQAFLVFNIIIYSFILSPRIIKKYYKQSTHTQISTLTWHGPDIPWATCSRGKQKIDNPKN